MLNRFRSRRLAALLTLAAATQVAGFLGAQAPRGGLSRPVVAPKLISDCDITVQSCGGDPTYGEGGGGGGSGYDNDAPATCSSGTPQQCLVDTSRTCTQFVLSSGSGSVTVSGGLKPGGSASGTATGTCISYRVLVRTYYWSKQ